MGWEYNSYGEPELQGWVWVDGKWSWGAVHMWHVVDLTLILHPAAEGKYVPPHQRNYYWTCTHWWYSRSWGQWFRQEMHTMEETKHWNIESWMLHKLTQDVKLLESRILHS